MAVNILSSPNIVPEVLGEHNYATWSACMKNYFLAQDLWDIIETTNDPPQQEDELANCSKTWRRLNAAALHAIQVSCGMEILDQIKAISSAKLTWDILEQMFGQPSQGVGSYGVDSYAGIEALLKAVQSGDWNVLDEFLEAHGVALSAKITRRGQTVLHVAVAAGHVDVVEKLVDRMSAEDLEIRDNDGYTALTEAAVRGKYWMADCMLRKNKNLINIRTYRGNVPVVMAIGYGQIEMARYLYSLTPLDGLMPYSGPNGAALCVQAIYTGTLDIALDLIQQCPRLALALDENEMSPLSALASRPNSFPSGTRLGFWKRRIYSSIPMQSVKYAIKETRLAIPKIEKRRSFRRRAGGSVSAILEHPHSKVVNFLGVKHLYEMKLIHVQSHELLRCMCEGIVALDTQQRQEARVYVAIIRAIQNGIYEFVFELLRATPDLLWTKDEKSRNIFSLAVLHRQAELFRLILGLHLKNAMIYQRDSNKDTILHMAGMLANFTILDRIPGAAMQMQRELQWFKDVESVVPIEVKQAINKDGLTPQELFMKHHKDMMKEGEQWMKGTATSCTVVAALIATIMFAAAFTIPGGNDQTSGMPMLLHENLFMLFIISDALSLFSSSTSVLMFLGILTSRYAKDDFRKSLPKKMIIGLATLFFSIATMMIAFSGALLIMLRGHSWIVFPIIALAGVPVTLFVLMQFPLLVEMFDSTYKSSIFDRKMEHFFYSYNEQYAGYVFHQ